MGDSSEAQAVLNELYEHTRGGARPPPPPSLRAPPRSRAHSFFGTGGRVFRRASMATTRTRRRRLTPRDWPPPLAEFPEDDAKRSAEQLKGIIHDTDGATCAPPLPLFALFSKSAPPLLSAPAPHVRSAQAKLASQLFDPQRGVLHFLKATTDPENSQDRSKSREHVLKGCDFH